MPIKLVLNHAAGLARHSFLKEKPQGSSSNLFKYTFLRIEEGKSQPTTSLLLGMPSTVVLQPLPPSQLLIVLMKSYYAKYPTDGSSKHIKRIAVFLLPMALLSGQLLAVSNF